MLYNFQKLIIIISLDVANYILFSLSDSLNHQLLVFLSFIIWNTNFSINENLAPK